jgi:hypothetical protein
MPTNPTKREVRSVYSRATSTAACAAECVAGLRGTDAAAIVFFAAPTHDGRAIARALRQELPGVPIVGCTTAGEFNEAAMGDGGVSAIALPKGIVRRAISAIGDLSQGVDEGVRAALRSLSDGWRVSLRELDPSRYVGLVLIEGMRGQEERINEVLGNEAPLLHFVGGTAGDDLKFERTEVFRDDQSSANGMALLLLELEVPYTILKTCSYEKLGRRLTITRVDPVQRIVWEIDGRPAAEAYAEALGTTADRLTAAQFSVYPLGLMMNDEAFIRCVQQVKEGGGLSFACRLLEGVEVEVMKNTDIVAETTAAVREAVARVGGSASGAVLFNCAWRKLEIAQKGIAGEYLASLGGIPAAGFHTYGESWLGHMNCTLTGLILGGGGR